MKADKTLIAINILAIGYIFVAIIFLFSDRNREIIIKPSEIINYDASLSLEKRHDNYMGTCRYILKIDGLNNAYNHKSSRYISFFDDCNLELQTEGISFKR